VPLAEKLQFQPAAAPDAARDLAIVSVDRANALYDHAHATTSGAVDSGFRLADGFAEVQRELGADRLAVPARPKHTLLDFYFRAAGVEGMTDPYLLETLVPRDLLPFERPFIVAHEWSHLAGYADEGEASFVGWLTCLHAGDADQYSGWLFLFAETMLSVAPVDRAGISRRLAPGPRDDLRSLAERRRVQLSPRVASAGWRVYDRYLRANRVETGAASYAGIVRLALGTRFGPGWTPLMRRSPG